MCGVKDSITERCAHLKIESVFMCSQITALVAATQGKSRIRQTTIFNLLFSFLFLINFVELLFDANNSENRKIRRANLTSLIRKQNKPNGMKMME